MIYGKKYDINKTSKVIIYGAATTGAIIYHNLIKLGFEVIAFIDKRADEIESYYDLPVWNLRQAETYFKKNDNVITIVGIKNVFEHEKTAKKLWEIGCSRIVFRPNKEIEGHGEIQDKALNIMYDQIMKGENPEEGYIIEGFEQFPLKDAAIIEEHDDYVIANIPRYYVFSDNYSDKKILWGNIPCLGLIPHIGLFKLFLGQDNEEYKEYMKFCREAALRSGGIVVSKAWEDSVYHNRLDVFNHMQYSWEHDRDFFIRNAVEADYNEKGYFNIRSGKHRIVYMLVKGSRYIPLKIKKADYYRWNGEEKAIELNELLTDLNKDALPIILGNPYFYNYPCNASNFYEEILVKVISLIYTRQYYEEERFDFTNKAVLFCNTTFSLYADIFKMLNFQVNICEDNENNREIINAILGDENGCIVQAADRRNDYFLAVIQDEMQSVELDMHVKYEIHISKEKNENQKLLASGLSEGEFLFAYMKTAN